MRNLLLFLLGLLLGREASAQRHYVCYYTPELLKIDGMGDEAAWQKAPWTEDYTDIEGDIRPKPTFRTRTKLLWDKENLYIYTELEEPDLWGELLKHDTLIYRDNDFEVFIDPDNDTHNYFELEINALGTVMDLFLAKPYRNGGKAVLGWDTHGLRSAVHVSGTMNRTGDTDKGWSVEMAIPLASLRFWDERALGDGSLVRINFSRVEWDKDVTGGKYVPRTDPSTGRRLPEHNWVWSPQGIINMHAPEKWGYLLLSARPVGTDTVAFVLPVGEEARSFLWEVYYKQQKYRAEHGVYATDLGALGLSSRGGALELIGTSLQYTALLKWDGVEGKLTIDQEGKIAGLK